MIERGLKQRIVGALVLVALAVIFVPMLFNREDNLRHVTVEAPPMPSFPSVPEVEVTPVNLPEPEPEPEPENVPPGTITASPASPAEVPAISEAAADATTRDTLSQSPAAEPDPAPAPAEPRLDPNTLPVSWSIQLASLSNRGSAEALQATLRQQGYNAYIRSVDGMNRVFVGPLVERAEANRLRDQLQKQHKLDGFVVRFKPEAA